jgi:hypothetical protein
MTNKTPITYNRLKSAFLAFGYQKRIADSHEVFQHPRGELVAVFPNMDGEEVARPVHVKLAENTIRDDGIIDLDDYLFFLEHGKKQADIIRKGDRLLWMSNGAEIPVVAASSEEDGAVVIKQNGSLASCPADQLRKLTTAPETSRN